MHKSRVLLQPAYVLHQKPYRDSSALLEIITPEYGRVALVARGIKKPASKMRAVLQPFSPMLVSWSGKSDLATLTTAESQGKVFFLKAEALTSGLYVNELIMRLTHRLEPQIELFSLYDRCLRQLHSISADSDSLPLQEILRYFELQLLHTLGFGLVLGKEANSDNAIVADAVYDYQLENGPVLLDSRFQEIYGVKISGKTLLALLDQCLAKQCNDTSVYKEAKRLTRYVLDCYLGGKPLMSRQLIRRKHTLSQL